MSLTIRDAQHLSWKTFKKFEKLAEKSSTDIGTGNDLAEKSAKIIEQLKLLENSNTKKSDVGKLISELLFSALVLSERHEINLEETFLKTVDDIIISFVS